jgi:hypothetical protein
MWMVLLIEDHTTEDLRSTPLNLDFVLTEPKEDGKSHLPIFGQVLVLDLYDVADNLVTERPKLFSLFV